MSWQTAPTGLGLLERYYKQFKSKMEKQKKESKADAKGFQKGMVTLAAKMESAKIVNAASIALMDEEDAARQAEIDAAEAAKKIGPLGLSWVSWGWISGGAIVAVLLVTGGQRRT